MALDDATSSLSADKLCIPRNNSTFACPASDVSPINGEYLRPSVAVLSSLPLFWHLHAFPPIQGLSCPSPLLLLLLLLRSTTIHVPTASLDTFFPYPTPASPLCPPTWICHWEHAISKPTTPHHQSRSLRTHIVLVFFPLSLYSLIPSLVFYITCPQPTSQFVFLPFFPLLSITPQRSPLL
jgi:hypothetical protein